VDIECNWPFDDDPNKRACLDYSLVHEANSTVVPTTTNALPQLTTPTTSTIPITASTSTTSITQQPPPTQIIKQQPPSTPIIQQQPPTSIIQQPPSTTATPQTQTITPPTTSPNTNGVQRKRKRKNIESIQKASAKRRIDRARIVEKINLHAKELITLINTQFGEDWLDIEPIKVNFLVKGKGKIKKILFGKGITMANKQEKEEQADDDDDDDDGGDDDGADDEEEGDTIKDKLLQNSVFKTRMLEASYFSHYLLTTNSSLRKLEIMFPLLSNQLCTFSDVKDWIANITAEMKEELGPYQHQDNSENSDVVVADVTKLLSFLVNHTYKQEIIYIANNYSNAEKFNQVKVQTEQDGTKRVTLTIKLAGDGRKTG